MGLSGAKVRSRVPLMPMGSECCPAEGRGAPFRPALGAGWLFASAVLAGSAGHARAQTAQSDTAHVPGSQTAQTQQAQTQQAQTQRAQTRQAKAQGQARAGSGTAQQIQVTGKRLTQAGQARARLAQIPGGTSVVDQSIVTKGRVLTNQDVLAFQPGVYAQAGGGADGIKISIRGSGLQNGTNYFRQGIYVLFDGLPVTGPGGTPYELFEPLGLDHTEILRGANAFDIGSVDLGGAINYVTKTGYDALPFQARAEFGSFGYTKEQLSSGQVLGPLDYYVSFTNSYRSGYQQQTRATSTGIVANVGYQIDPDITTRFYFRYRQTEDQYPGYLTSTQIAQDPTQAQSPFNKASYGSLRIQPGSTWVGNKTSIQIDDKSHIDIGEVYHNYPIEIRETSYDAVWGYDDFTESAQYLRNDTIFGQASNTDIGFFSTTHLHGFQTSTARILTGQLAGVPFGSYIRRANYEGSDNNLHLGNNTNLWRNLWLMTGVSLVYDRRGTSVTYPVTASPSFYREALNVAPRAGLRYAFRPNLQVFANVSRTVEPPNDWEYLSGPTYTTGPATGLNSGAKELRNETATTFEIGTSGEQWGNSWSVDYYHSSVRNELLTVNTAASLAVGQSTYGNASPTTHQGVEAGLDTTLWQNKAARLWLRQAYTFSQFNFNNDPQLGSNQLPGVPRHYYQGEIRLDLKNGFYGYFQAQVASRIPIDYANTDYTRPYHTLGLTVGYDDEHNGRQVFLDFENLTNEHYAAVVTPTLDDHGVPGAFLQPGDGFGVFGGVAFGFR